MLLCLFDRCVADEEKEKTAETLLQGKGHHDAVPKKRKGNGKPKFPEKVNEEPSLADLTEDFWYFFRLFLQKDVKDCGFLMKNILNEKKRASMIAVVNDSSD